MTRRGDWLPTTREGIVGMATKWNMVLAEKGAGWGLPADVISGLETLSLDAQAAYSDAMVKDRTTVLTAKINESFKALVAAMRDIKKRWFHIPPLTPVDMASLGLGMHDDIRTNIPVPVDTARGSIQLSVRFQLTVVWEIIPVAGSDQRANHGVRINYGVHVEDTAAQCALTGRYYYLSAPPHSPDQLAADDFTGRKRHTIEFPAEDSGKTAWFCLRVENAKGDKGPWGEMFCAVIP